MDLFLWVILNNLLQDAIYFPPLDLLYNVLPCNELFKTRCCSDIKLIGYHFPGNIQYSCNPLRIN